MKVQVREHVRRTHPWDLVRIAAHLPNFVRLFFRLLADRYVSGFAKLLMVSAAIYAVSPLDFLPDLMPLAGQMDDLTIFLMASRMFLQLCPKERVRMHVADIDRTGRWAPFAD